MVRAMTYTNPFGDIENKDLAEAADTENKSADSGGETDPEEGSGEEATVPSPDENSSAESASSETVEVEMLHHDYDPFEGKNLIPGDVVTVRTALAQTLVGGERARYVSAE